MAREVLDTTGNEDMGVILARVNRMFTALYAADSANPDWVGDSITASTSVDTDVLTATGLATVESAALDTGTKTASATGGAATLNKTSGAITSEAITTAAGASYTLTLTNSKIAATSMVFASVQYGTASAGTPSVTMITPGSGTVDIVVQNVHASAAFDGTIVISFMALDA